MNIDQIDITYLNTLKYEIDLILIDINMMSHTINRMQHIISIVENKDLVNEYNKDLKRILEDFAILAKVVINQIKCYLEESTKLNLPIDFRYHKILKDYDSAINTVQ